MTRPGWSGSGCAITWLEMSTSAGTGSPANGLDSGNGNVSHEAEYYDQREREEELLADVRLRHGGDRRLKELRPLPFLLSTRR